MIRFAVITDVQYGNLDDLGARTYRESISKFLRAAGEIATEEVLFTLQLGDASQSDWENHLAIKELFDIAEKAGIKWKHVLGNHDFLVDNEKKPDLYADFGLEKPGYYDFVVNDPEDELQTHTTYSHGTGSVEDNVREALNKGMGFIDISDH